MESLMLDHPTSGPKTMNYLTYWTLLDLMITGFWCLWFLATLPIKKAPLSPTLLKSMWKPDKQHVATERYILIKDIFKMLWTSRTVNYELVELIFRVLAGMTYLAPTYYRRHDGTLMAQRSDLTMLVKKKHYSCFDISMQNEFIHIQC